MKSEVFNCDNMELMAKYPDNHFELAIVDPPYGIDAGNTFSGEKRKSGNGSALKSAFEKKDWDVNIPSEDYFKELMRVSKNQIIWGANYMTHYLPPSMGWIVWDKDNGTTKFSDCELAFSSFNQALRKYKFTWNGMLQGDMKNKEKRYHPTQKPVRLYEWLLSNYAKEGDKILDTHGGSMSSVIACLNLGFEITCTELDKDYYEEAKERINEHQRQQGFFTIKQELIFNDES
jgi:site-specific DNA-methyltransferase (adenine-specific)